MTEPVRVRAGQVWITRTGNPTYEREVVFVGGGGDGLDDYADIWTQGARRSKTTVGEFRRRFVLVKDVPA